MALNIGWSLSKLFVNDDAVDTYEDNELRFESKFISELTNLDAITRWLKGHRAGFRVLHPVRQVNNLYFDTFDYRSYGDNLAGISRRIKTRLRWYGDAEGGLPSSALEFKHRVNKQGWKDSYPLNKLALTDDWRHLIAAISRQLPVDARHTFYSFPMPTLINNYSRAYYLSSDGHLRVTVDKNIKVFDQRNTTRPKFSPKINLPEYLVVEFKYHHDDFQSVDGIIRDFPLRPSRSSKYVTGVKAIVEAV
jgi:SPX domain protein involved in polyphosphate accumulation